MPVEEIQIERERQRAGQQQEKAVGAAFPLGGTLQSNLKTKCEGGDLVAPEGPSASLRFTAWYDEMSLELVGSNEL